MAYVLYLESPRSYKYNFNDDNNLFHKTANVARETFVFFILPNKIEEIVMQNFCLEIPFMVEALANFQ